MTEYTIWFTLTLLALVPACVLFALRYCPPAPRVQLRDARLAPARTPDSAGSSDSVA